MYLICYDNPWGERLEIPVKGNLSDIKEDFKMAYLYTQEMFDEDPSGNSWYFDPRYKNGKIDEIQKLNWKSQLSKEDRIKLVEYLFECDSIDQFQIV